MIFCGKRPIMINVDKIKAFDIWKINGSFSNRNDLHVFNLIVYESFVTVEHWIIGLDFVTIYSCSFNRAIW